LLTVPDDPFGVGELKYNGRVVYSVGPNGFDDGGKLVSREDVLVDGDFLLDMLDMPDAVQAPGTQATTDNSDTDADAD
jgi:hypothetical protein